MFDFLETILNGKKIDLTKKEDHDKFVENLNKLKSDSSSLLDMFGIKNTIDDEVDNMIDYADKIYNDSSKVIESNHHDSIEIPVTETSSTSFVRPSEKLDDEARKNIQKIVTEYIDTVITPVYKMDSKQYNDVHDGFTEFASWIYTR